ncbi:MAG: phosphomannomutase/phosphoglucomutase [Patescibacteria group bacterium]
MENLDKIFKAYDVRGIYPDEINQDIAYKIGRASAFVLSLKPEDKTFKLREKTISKLVVARDNRLSSEELFSEMTRGIKDQGIDVIDIGMATAPMFYQAIIKFKTDGGIMVTASHNPKEYNGFKIFRKNALPMGGEGLKRIKGLIESKSFKDAEKKGKVIKKEILKEYVTKILDLSHANDIGQFKVIADTGNGMAGETISALIPELKKVDLINLFGEIDGSFPNHDPNPINPENTKMLQQKVVLEKADFGIAFDGDGDRILFIDEEGQRIDPDLISAVIIHYYFKRGGIILYTAASSRIIKEEALDSGNDVICSRVGHSFIKETMAREEVIFGCEASGHYYFKDTDYVEAPFLVFIKIMEILSKVKVPLSKLIEHFNRFQQEKIEIKIQDIRNAEIHIKRVEEKYKKISRFGRLPNIFHIDGLTVEYTDWWFNLRPSNTESVLRLTIEADTQELLAEQKQELLKSIPFLS